MNGPVNVLSLDSTSIFSSERVHNGNGFVNELMGFPNSQLTDEYWFPWYDNMTMQSWILVGNPSTDSDAHVHIFIAGVEQPGSPYTIPPGGRITPTYPVLNGPVHITSDIDVFASQRVHNATGFINEAAGIPNNQLTTQYWFPWNDNLSMQSWILVGNPSGSQVANVQIYIKGNLQTVPESNPPTTTFVIPPGGNVTPRWKGSINGPVRVVNDIPIFTSERVFTVPTDAFNEFMGIPFSQFTTEYWFTWYDSVYMNNKVLISKP